jgi:hypothetical protein
VLLRAKEPPSHYVADPRDKNYTRNFYLIFPSDEELGLYEPGGDEDSNRLQKTVYEKSESLFLDTEKVDTVFASQSLNTKEEPSIKKNHEDQQDTHTHEGEPAPAASSAVSQPPTQGVVCVSDEVTLDDFWDYAGSPEGKSLETPGAWINTNFNNPVARETVRRWKLSRQPEMILETRQAPTDQLMFFGEAAQIVHTMMEAHSRDAESIIAELPVTDEVRARLLEKFSGGEKVEAL